MISRSAGTLIVALIMLPLVLLWADGGPLNGLVQESGGYRYYNSLRLFHGERPWQPQAQVLGLVHIGFQLGLSAAGYPEPAEERYELWIKLGQAVTPILTVIAFWWAVGPIISVGGRILLAALIVSTAFEWRTGGGFAIINPDYLWLCIPASLVMLGVLLRDLRPSWRAALLVGLFGGLCLSIKPTYAYALPLGFVLLFQVRSLRDLAPLVTAGLVAVLLSVGVLVAYYQFDPAAIIAHPRLTQEFMATQAVPVDSFFNWWWQTVTTWPISRATITCLAPFVLAASALLPGRRREMVALLLGLLFALVVLSRRPAPNTWTETEYYAMMALVYWARMVVAPAIAPRLGQLSRPLIWNVVALVLAAALLYFEAVPNALALTNSVKPILRAGERTRPVVEGFLQEGSRRAAWLMADGKPYLVTSHGDRAKGGTDVGSTHYSPWMREAWPHDPIIYWGGSDAGRVNLPDFDRVIVTSDAFRVRTDSEAPVPFEMVDAEVQKGFKTDLRGFTCVTYPPSQTRWIAVLCRRTAS